MNLFRPSRPLSAIATPPLLVMCVCIVLAAGPLLSRVAPWAAALLILAAVARLLMNRRATHLPSLPLKVGLFAVGAVTVGSTYGTMLGVEPGLSVLLLLVSLKIVETNGERDFQVIALLGYFLGLCDLFFSQDLLVWLYVGAVFVAISGTLIRFHRGPGRGASRQSFRLAGTLLLQALPIVGLLFLFVPREYGGFRFQFARSLLNGSGMSDRMSPGSIASLVLNEEPVFRVEFPDGNAPAPAQMYWRGMVLWRGDGLTWVAGSRVSEERHPGQLTGPAIRQYISLQPNGGRWIFALDRPVANQGRFEDVPGGCLQNPRLIFTTLRYAVVSRSENREATIPADQLAAATTISEAVPPTARMRQLVKSWTDQATKPWDVVERCLAYFHTENFSYTLEPGSYGGDPLDEFLFERRQGFCEHYAGAFASLMRLAGIPSRIVIGYHGGEVNKRLGSYVIVRQSDAHAWCEVWIKGSGWSRVDPTEAIAPDRISSGLAPYLGSTGGAEADLSKEGATGQTGWREFVREASLAWDSINYQWDLRVLNFDEDNQRSFLAMLGFGSGDWLSEMLIVGSVGIGIICLVALWLRRSRRPAFDEAAQWWRRFCRALERAGIRRRPAEGPLAFGQRAAHEAPAHRHEILRVAELYSAIRYAAAPPPACELTEAVRTLPPLTARRKPARKSNPSH